MTAREYEVIVWGATGFTGKLVAAHLLQTYGAVGQLRWAMAGRSRDRLEAARAALGAAGAQVPLLVAEARDPAAMRELSSKTAVICSTVGPYALYGSPLVEACVAAGTDYCDLCGEPQWMRRMIDLHHDDAKGRGVRIVHSCGFDSIPSDLGVAALNDHAESRFGHPCSKVSLRVERLAGALSGGTVASMFSTMEAARKDRDVARVLRDPYSLNPEGERSGPDGGDLQSSRYDSVTNAWIAPFIMAGINTRVVRRSNALLGYAYGKEFRYDEALLVGSGVAGRAKSALTAAGLGAFGVAAFLTPGLLRPLLNKPGQGPSKRQQEQGSFSMLLLGSVDGAQTLKLRVTGDRDPGYGSTSKMLGESAVCLARDVSGDVKGGVLTPAASMSAQLRPRLIEKAGLTFDVLHE